MTSLRSASAHVLVDSVDLPTLDDAARHHLFRVLRLRDGEPVTVTDGRGRWRPCRVAGESLEADGEANADAAQPLPTIGVAIPKHDRPEWIVQKLVEIGVGRILWLHADRSVVRWDAGRAAKRNERFQRVAVEALQQSRRTCLPTIAGPISADEFLPTGVACEPGGRPMSSSDATVAIGPEGGWTERELSLATDTVSLGEAVLRVETAAVVAAVKFGHRE